MPPAFSSARGAGAFAALLLVLLLLPALLGKSALPPREEIYSSVPRLFGDYPYFREQIFEEKGDIDIAFMGSSRIWYGIDTPYVQKALGQGGAARTLAWPWHGFDALYFIARDLLQHRRVHMLVITDEYEAGMEIPQKAAARWFRFGDDADALAGLSFPVRVAYYSSAILGMPRNLLCLLRPNIPDDTAAGQKNFLEVIYHAENPAARLGSMAVAKGFPGRASAFVNYTPATPAPAKEARAYSPETKAMFAFTGERIPESQLHFARKLAELAGEHGTKLVVLHIPMVAGIRDPLITEPEFWPDICPGAAMVGIPSAKLFAGLPRDDVMKLFCDTVHLNKNGQAFFTAAVTPRLLQMYETER